MRKMKSLGLRQLKVCFFRFLSTDHPQYSEDRIENMTLYPALSKSLSEKCILMRYLSSKFIDNLTIDPFIGLEQVLNAKLHHFRRRYVAPDILLSF